MVSNQAIPKRWRLKPEPAAIPQGAWPPLIGRLLAHRGVGTAAEARAFFDSGPSPSLDLPDLEHAVGRLARACRRGETIAVYSDFDVDGVTAAALLTEGLASLGARPIPYLPHRVREGYGLNMPAIDTLRGLGATLLVTADCGTSSLDEVAFARSRGMAVIILDHHTVPPQLPAASAIVNPKRTLGATDELAACGIAYHVLLTLHEALGRQPDEPFRRGGLELAALGTVCDLAPLRGENRRLVREGLRALSRSERPGLRALMAVAGVEAARVDTEAIGYALGPRLNAAGRMAHARLAFDLLTSREDGRAQELAGELDALNRERQRATEAALRLAGELLAGVTEAPLLMLGHPDLPAGVIGLVAAKLSEAYYRPAVVYEQGQRLSRASARSIPRFDLAASLRACPEGLFERFGGHRAAAGFTARNERLPAIKERLLAEATTQLSGTELTPVIDLDAELPLASLRGEEIRWLSRLAPHGIGNPEPTFLSRSVRVVECRPVGTDGQHRRLKLRDGRITWPAIVFRYEGDGIEEGVAVDVVYTVSADRQTENGLELRVLDLRPAERSGA